MVTQINLPKWLKPVSSTGLIRLGRNNDGGYLVPQYEIMNKSNLISFGVNDDWSFERDFLKINPDSNVYLFDRSVSFLQLCKLFLKNIFHFPDLYPLLNSIQAILSFNRFINKPNVFFYKFFIGRRVYGESLSLDECFKIAGISDKNNALKIDIEGSEYRILDEVILKKELFDIIIIEFHDIDIHISKIEKFLKELEFSIVHLHVNNYSKADVSNLPKDIEVTLLRNFKTSHKNTAVYPLPIDMPSNRKRPDEKIVWI